MYVSLGVLLVIWGFIIWYVFIRGKKKDTTGDPHNNSKSKEWLHHISHLPIQKIFGVFMVILGSYILWNRITESNPEVAVKAGDLWGKMTGLEVFFLLCLLGFGIYSFLFKKGEHGAPDGEHKGGHTQKESIFSLYAKVWGSLLAIVFVPVLLYFVVMNWGEIKHSLLSHNTGVRELVGTYEIVPGAAAVKTVYVKDFEIETDGRAISINYTGTDTFVPYQSHGEVTEDESSLPSGACAGPLRIKSNGETTPFTVRLYKIQ